MPRLIYLCRLSAALLGYFLFALGTLLISLLLLVGLGPLPIAAARKRRWTRQCLSHIARLFVRLLQWLKLMTFELIPRTPQAWKGELIVANHPSLLDAVFLMAMIPEACFVVKAATTRNPLFGGLVALAGYIPNDHYGPDLVAEAAAVLQGGDALVIFPEGTRTSESGALVFQRGAANIALAAACPIRPVVIEMIPQALHKNQPWYRLPDERPHYSLRAIASLSLDQLVDRRAPASLQARALTRALQNKFARELHLQG